MCKLNMQIKNSPFRGPGGHKDAVETGYFATIEGEGSVAQAMLRVRVPKAPRPAFACCSLASPKSSPNGEDFRK
jgi:hypothetical protein